MKKRCLSWLLTLVMVFSLVQTSAATAFASEEDGIAVTADEAGAADEASNGTANDVSVADSSSGTDGQQGEDIAGDEAGKETVSEESQNGDTENTSEETSAEEEKKAEVKTQESEEEAAVQAESGVVNDNYPWGTDMNTTEITLHAPAKGKMYVLETANEKEGNYTQVGGISISEEGTVTFTPTEGNWYRFNIDGNRTEAVRTVQLLKGQLRIENMAKPIGVLLTQDILNKWYISNDMSAYNLGDDKKYISVLGYDGDYWLGGSRNSRWEMATSSNGGGGRAFETEELRCNFRNNYVNIEVKLKDTENAFGVYADTCIGTRKIVGDYFDNALLRFRSSRDSKNIQIIGTDSEENITEEKK